MKRGFWTLVTRFNARVLFLLTVLLAVASALWWTALRKVGEDHYLEERAAVEGAPSDMRVFAEHPDPEPDRDMPDEIVNPFTSRYLEQRLAEAREAERRRREEEERRREEEERLAAEEAERKRAAEAEEPEETEDAVEVAAVENDEADEAIVPEDVEAQPPERVNVLYRGLFLRPDGTRMALIEVGDDRANFYPVGSSLAGYSIEEARRRAVVLRGEDGSPLILQLGDSASIEKR